MLLGYRTISYSSDLSSAILNIDHSCLIHFSPPPPNPCVFPFFYFFTLRTRTGRSWPKSGESGTQNQVTSINNQWLYQPRQLAPSRTF